MSETTNEPDVETTEETVEATETTEKATPKTKVVFKARIPEPGVYRDRVEPYLNAEQSKEYIRDMASNLMYFSFSHIQVGRKRVVEYPKITDAIEHEAFQTILDRVGKNATEAKKFLKAVFNDDKSEVTLEV